MKTTQHAAKHLAILSGILLTNAAHGQAREPLCRTVETRRIFGSQLVPQDTQDALRVLPLRGEWPGQARFVALWREAHPATDGGTTLRMTRLDSRLQRVGEMGAWTSPALTAEQGRGALAAVVLRDSLLVLVRAGSSIQRLIVARDGSVRAEPLLTLPSDVPAPNATPLRIEWVDAIARGDGAIAMLGLTSGEVRAYRFDAAGAVSAETTWTQRVGGVMRLLPTSATQSALAMLERTLPGQGADGETPAVQMLVTLDEQLLPVGVPERTGYAHFPWSVVARSGGALEVHQWVRSQGVAIGRVTVSARRAALEAPRLWFAQPPFEGRAVASASIVGRGGVAYGAVVTERAGGSLESQLAWVAPSGEPMLRRSVVPLSGRLLMLPALAAAEDGYVMFAGAEDETGFGIDAFHVRCDMVTREASAP
ncbi:MAG: hypothetical protein Q8Q09_06820 [Deltaproteobacteria bacterium]|nr:hypothetical protein [Deltaproteobacteria bacterium]